jgi:hypothetical protein
MVKANTPAAENLFWESRVAESLGVARKLVVSIRKEHLAEGAHYRKEKNNVVLTPAGLERLKQRLAVHPDSTPPPGEATLPGPPPRQQMIVARVPVNLRLLWCRAKGDKTERQTLVRVKDNTNFMPGMEFQAVQAGENFWQYTGRLPRRKGRW